MSSNEKISAREAEQQKAAKEMRTYRIIGICVAVFLVLAIVAVLVLNSNFLYTKATAVDVNGTSYSAAEVNFAYFSEYNNFYQSLVNYIGEEYASQFLPQQGVSFKTQTYRTTEDGKTVTWHDQLMSMAKNRLEGMTAIYNEAKKNGFELSDAEKLSVEQQISQVSTYAANYFVTREQYLTLMYGKGMNEEVFRKCVEFYAYVSAYETAKQDTFTFSQSELKDYYAAHKDENAYYTLSYAFISASDADGKTTDADMEAARVAAEIIGDAKDAESFEAAVQAFSATLPGDDSDVTHATTTFKLSDLPEEYASWVGDPSRKAGDSTVFKQGGDADSTHNGYYVFIFHERDDNDYNTRNGFYVAVGVEQPKREDFDSEGAYDVAVQKAKDDADAKIKKIADGWATGKYKTLAELQKDFSADMTTSSNIVNANMNTVPLVFMDWLFDASRSVGDTTTVSQDTGRFFVYYGGEGPNAADLVAEEALKAEKFSQWEEDVVKGYEAKEKWASRFCGGIFPENYAG